MQTARGKTREWVLWIVAVSCALHATEEFFTGWQAWARITLGISAPTSLFVLANSILVAVALLTARLGWRRPTAALVIPCATLVNALAFHITPTLLQRHIAPGLYTAVFLYLPFSTWALVGASLDGVGRSAIVRAAIAGMAVAVGVVLAARAL